MKSLYYLPLFFLLGNKVSNVTALPAGTATEKRDDIPLAALGEAASDIQTIADLPHIPLDRRYMGQDDDSPLAALGELVSEIQPVTDLPHIPLGSRDESHDPRIAMVKERASDTFGTVVDLDRPVPFDAYKKLATKDVGGPENVSGHPVPSELVDLLVQKGYLGSNPVGGVPKDKRTTFNAETQLING